MHQCNNCAFNESAQLLGPHHQLKFMNNVKYGLLSLVVYIYYNLFPAVLHTLKSVFIIIVT